MPSAPAASSTACCRLAGIIPLLFQLWTTETCRRPSARASLLAPPNVAMMVAARFMTSNVQNFCHRCQWGNAIGEDFAIKFRQGVSMTNSKPTPQRLRQLRQRAGLTMREMADGLGLKGPSGYRYYETETAFTRPFLPMEMAPTIRKMLVGKGKPEITYSEVDSLFGDQPENTLGDDLTSSTESPDGLITLTYLRPKTINRELLLYMSKYLECHPDTAPASIPQHQYVILSLFLHDIFAKYFQEIVSVAPSIRATSPAASGSDEVNQELFHMARMLIRHGVAAAFEASDLGMGKFEG